MGGFSLYFSHTVPFADALSALLSLAYTTCASIPVRCRRVYPGGQLGGLHKMLETWKVYLVPRFVSQIEMVYMRVPCSVWWVAGALLPSKFKIHDSVSYFTVVTC